MMPQEITDKDGKTNWEKTHEAMQRELDKGNLIDKPAVERARDALGGMAGGARDAIDGRTNEIDKQVKDATGE